jgi:3-hydroxybutyryl-CoA dehydrogenase
MSTEASLPADPCKVAAVAVIGAGLMGHGIAAIFAAAGHRVALHDPDARMLGSAKERIAAIFDLLAWDKADMVGIRCEPDFAAAVAGADFVFEAGPEKLEVKRAIFKSLGETSKPDAILCTNTSAIPIGQIGADVADRSRVVGTHYWNPPHLVPLVEVVQAKETSLATVEKTIALLRAVGKSPVHVRRDIPGFIGNRLQHALKREAIALVAAGVCDAETIDNVVKEGFGARMAVLGPMEQSDLVGLNLTLDIHKTLIPDLDRTPVPHPLLVEKVAKGELGMANRKGFRDWTPEQAAAVRKRLSDFLAQSVRALHQKKRSIVTPSA